MPLHGNVSQNIHELVHHGTKERSHEQVVAIAIKEAKKAGKYKNSRLHQFYRLAFEMAGSGKLPRSYTEPLKTQDPFRMERGLGVPWSYEEILEAFRAPLRLAATQAAGKAVTPGFEYATDRAGRDEWAHRTDDAPSAELPPSHDAPDPSSVSPASSESSFKEPSWITRFRDKMKQFIPVHGQPMPEPSSQTPTPQPETPQPSTPQPITPHAQSSLPSYIFAGLGDEIRDRFRARIPEFNTEVTASGAQSHSGLPQQFEPGGTHAGWFLSPDDLFSGIFGHPLETFVSPNPSQTFRLPGKQNHGEALIKMHHDLGIDPRVHPDFPGDRNQAVNAGWVLGRTGNVNGHRVTSFWNNPGQVDSVKTYVLQQIKEGRLHPENDLIAFKGMPGFKRAGEFAGYVPQGPQVNFTPEELAKMHFDPNMRQAMQAAGLKKVPQGVGSSKPNPMRDALIRAGLLHPGQNWRSPFEAQRQGEPTHLERGAVSSQCPFALSLSEALGGLIRKAAERVHPNPTDPQRKAGNYRMGHVTIQGMDVTIESPAGSTRKGKDKKGKPWEVVMKHHYGYVKRTLSEADKDHVDVFIGPHPESELVFIIDQNKVGSDDFDEHKCMLGFVTADEAKRAYHDNYSPGWKGFRHIRALTVDQFKKWVKSGDTHLPIEKQVLTFSAKPIKLSQIDHDAFHDSIAAAPEDAAPKLVYADYLHDAGFPGMEKAMRHAAVPFEQRNVERHNLFSVHPHMVGTVDNILGMHPSGRPIFISLRGVDRPPTPIPHQVTFAEVSGIPGGFHTTSDLDYIRQLVSELHPGEDEAAGHSRGSAGSITRHQIVRELLGLPPYEPSPQPQQFDRPLPDWIPKEDPDHPTLSPEKTGWVPVQSTWIGGIKMTPDRVTHMYVKKGGKSYDYPGLNLDMFRRWVRAKSPGKWWWRNIGYPMMDLHGTLRPHHQFSRFTGHIHPMFGEGIDRLFQTHYFDDPLNTHTPEEAMDWARRHIHPQITPAHLSALVGALPGTHTRVETDEDHPIGYGHYLAGHEPTELSFSTTGPGYSAYRTLKSKNLSNINTPRVYNDSLVVDPYVGARHSPNFFRGVSGPNLLRQMRAAYELGIPRIDWFSGWNEAGEGGGFGDFTGGLHWPMIGADGMVPHEHIPMRIIDEADRMSNGRFHQTWLFSDFFQSPKAKQWYAQNPRAHDSFVDTTPGSYSRTNVERHVAENAARHGMEGPIPDESMMQKPLTREPIPMGESQQPAQFMYDFQLGRERYHDGIEHLLTTGSTHPDYFDLYFNK